MYGLLLVFYSNMYAYVRIATTHFSSGSFYQHSYCRGMGVRPSGVRKLRLLVDPDQILMEAAYPPYLQIFFSKIFNFQIFTIFFRSLTLGPIGAKISKHYF